MKKTFLKNLFRDIKKSISRFLSIAAIIAVGVAFLAGVRATSPDMKMSGDLYFFKSNLMDFKLISTWGLDKDDISEIEKLEGVSGVEGSYSIDAVVERDKRSLVLNINSIPTENGINKIRIIEGRMPEKDNEAVVEEKFLKDNKLKVGDMLELKSGKESKIEDDLENSKFSIVGSAQSPLYISAQRQLSSIGNGSVKGFVYILPSVFKSDVFTEAYVKIDSIESKNSLLSNADYNKTTENIENDIKNLSLIRIKARYEEVLKTAQNKINEAEDKLNSAKEEAADKFDKGYKQLDQAKSKIAEGEIELNNNELIFNEKMAESEKQIAEGKKQLDESQGKLNAGLGQAASNISSAIKGKTDEAKKQLDMDLLNPIFIAQYNLLNKLYENDIKGKDFYGMYNSLKADGALNQIKPFFDMEALKYSFDNTKTEIESNRERIALSEVQLNKAKQEGIAKINDGRKELDDAKKEINKNTKNLKTEEEKAYSKFKDAEAEIQKNKEKLKDIKEPKWYVLGRSANIGYETYRLDSERIGNIGKLFPLIFFLVAALVSLTTMTRMVQENRTEIGTFKALGYSRTSIVSHYLLYSIMASLTGSLIGISFAFKLFPPLIMNAYRSLYTIPERVVPFDFQSALEASIVAVLFTALATVAATLEELKEAPASLMRPKPPKSGKRIMLERIPFIWKRLSFTEKVTARNIFRYKQRFFMTVIGIAACTGLIITGFGLKSGVIGSTQYQFNKIYRYDMQTTFIKNLNNEEKDAVSAKVLGMENVKTILFRYLKNGTVKDRSANNQDAFIIVPEYKDDLNRYINLTMNGKDLKLDNNGVIMTEKLAKLTNKRIGDTVEITVNDKTINAKVTAVTEHYIQHYIYMSPDFYQKMTGETLELNGFYGLLKDTSESVEKDMAKTLTSISNVGSVSYKNNVQIDSDKSMNSINSVVLVLIISAGVLAFVVIYNLTNININERRRELATIKLLGFYNNELAAYIYRENIILTLAGSLFGIAFGKVQTKLILNSAETNVLLFLKTIEPVYFLYSVLLTILFSVIVNIVLYKEFGRIDMIESLKSAE